MAKLTYIKIFVDYLDALEPLGDAERGRLFTSLLTYARTGEAPQLNGNERFLFPLMRANIDRDKPKYRTGEDHPNWKGGVTPQNQKERGSPRYAAWRIAVFCRDNYTCQICGRKGGTLNAHHIEAWAKNPSKRFLVDNGVTLCKPCHQKLHKRGM